jgi:hypothetical protein
MIAIGLLFVRMLCDCFKSRQRLEAEILVLQHQLNVLQQRVPHRVHLRWTDHALFIWLYRRCPRILDAITIVRPETVVRLYRRGFAAYSTPSTFGEFLRNMRPTLMRCELTFCLGRTRPAHVRSSASEMLSRIRSWAGYTIDTRESNFSKATDGVLGTHKSGTIGAPARDRLLD